MPFRADDLLNRVMALAGDASRAATRLLRDRTLRLAVTGLSRAGKTVFLTSLLHNLRSAVRNPNHLPELLVAQEARLLAVRLAPLADMQAAPLFPYEKNIHAMAAAEGAWPLPTEGVSQIALEIDFHPTGILRANRATVRVEITDYPGEWLLDLGLLGQTYAAWSAATLALSESGLRAPLAAKWRGYLAAHPADEPADDTVATTATALYREYLVQCRDRHGLSYLQPGRILTTALSELEPALHFCPLPGLENISVSGSSLGALMERRFEAYKKDVRARFLAPYFTGIDRQVVLVDVLRALAAGRETFEDTKRALAEIAAALRANRGWLDWLWGGGPQRVMFAATKADHVPEIQRGQLEGLLRALLGVDVLGLRGKSDFDVTRIAAVRSTKDEMRDGIPVVIGLPVGATQRRSFFVRGGLPVEPPATSFAGNLLHDIPVFQPPRVRADVLDGIPHIGLDHVAEYLLGDRLA